MAMLSSLAARLSRRRCASHGAVAASVDEENMQGTDDRKQSQRNAIPEVLMDGDKVRRRVAHIGGQGLGHEDVCERLSAEKGRGQRLCDQETLPVFLGEEEGWGVRDVEKRITTQMG